MVIKWSDMAANVPYMYRSATSPTRCTRSWTVYTATISLLAISCARCVSQETARRHSKPLAVVADPSFDATQPFFFVEFAWQP